MLIFSKAESNFGPDCTHLWSVYLGRLEFSRRILRGLLPLTCALFSWPPAEWAVLGLLTYWFHEYVHNYPWTPVSLGDWSGSVSVLRSCLGFLISSMELTRAIFACFSHSLLSLKHSAGTKDTGQGIISTCYPDSHGFGQKAEQKKDNCSPCHFFLRWCSSFCRERVS